jgi:hypothetical protein
MDEEKKIYIDEDWKAQVEAEKEAAKAFKEQPPEETPKVDDNDPEMPPASFAMLVSTLATESFIALGMMAHPMTGEVAPRRNQAKYLIDTIAMLAETTKGNVPAEETAGVDELLHSLRMAFLQMPK